ncbi:S8 family peptidase [Hyalangium rubrum]|uniref:S8 family serine peptidase n=1 Tax=Hyalangium rubrum TaxID=3103134 RepID=A0ABU5H0R4_9BACT|nr:S8 family serine peptidase [Hyalangium sp. s54d21]MDY7226377.1 S8 family serine peptidase [Hyalangium sp. s54d21]
MKAVLPPGVHYTGEIHVKLRETGSGTRLAMARAPSRRTLTAIARSAGVRAVGAVVDGLPAPTFRGARMSADLPRVVPGGELARWHTVKLPGSGGSKKPKGARPSGAPQGVAMAMRGSAAPAMPAGPSPDEVWNAVHALMEQPEVEYAEPDAVLVHPTVELPEPPGKNFPRDWHLRAIRAPQAWRLFEKAGRLPGEGILIGHLDTGWSAHPAVPGPDRLLPGVDLWDRHRPDARDPLESGMGLSPGHGTATLCLLAANHEDYQGVATYASVLPVRVSPSVVQVGSHALALGILHCVSQGAQVISISMGGLPSRLWADAVNHAYEQGVVVCAAAGNHFPLGGSLRTPTSVVYPARFHRVLAVSGITQGLKRYRFNDRMSGNDGPEVDLCAPTPDVLWALPPEDYRPGRGTSTATPQVAGAAALWLSYHRQTLEDFSPVERVEACRRALLLGASDVGPYPYHPRPEEPARKYNEYFGDGRLNVEATLRIKPIRGLQPQPRDDVSWALLKLLGVGRPVAPAGAPVDADQVELLWATHTVGVQRAVQTSIASVVSERLRARLELP